MKPQSPVIESEALLHDIRQLIEDSRSRLAVTVNSALTLLYWNIGQRIHSEVLKGERAEYGEQIVATLAKQLETGYGRGFSSKNLRHMLRFAESFPEEHCLDTVETIGLESFFRTDLSKDPLQRDFLEMCQERWSSDAANAKTPCCSSAPRYHGNPMKY